MLEITKKILTNILVALYQPFGFAVLIAILFMFVYMFAKEHGWKKLLQRWINCFKTDIGFRRTLVLAFYTALILFRTLLNRNIWVQPLGNVMGIWGLYDQNGELTTEVIENFVLFVPFMTLLLWGFREQIIGEEVKLFVTIWKSGAIVLCVSMIIEFLQLLLHLGTFQLSDIFYNTLGGLTGGLLYWCCYKLLKRKDK